MCNKFYEKCVQCPRRCSINRNSGKTGVCGEDNQLRIALACLHFGEEPLVTVHGGSGTIFFTGCTLRCAFCQNYQISQDGLGKDVSKDEFVKICLELQKAGAENINLITGSHQIPLIAEYLKAARQGGCTIPYCWNSSAYESVEMLELLKPYVSIWLPDLKTLNPDVSKKLFAAQDYPQVATKAISWMIKNFPMEFSEEKSKCDYTDSNGYFIKAGTIKDKMQQGVIIRHLFLPGRFEDTAETLQWLKENADSQSVISLMSQYTPVPFNENEKKLSARKQALCAIENRLVTQTEDQDLQDLIEAFDFDLLFYQELSDDTDWLPDFCRKQPFSNKLAKPIWHCNYGFCQ